VIALGVCEHGDLAGHPQLEQLIEHPDRHQGRRNLHQKRDGPAVSGDLVLDEPSKEHIIPHVLGAEPKGWMVGFPGDLELREGLLDSIPRREVLRSFLMRGHTLLGDPERCEPIQHCKRSCFVGSAVVQAVQHVAVEIDVTHRLAGCIAWLSCAQHRVAVEDPA
jgi:hypothetical protein